jgi:hypothetical protein
VIDVLDRANSVSNARVGMALTGHKSHAAYMDYVHGDREQARALADQLATLAEGLANSSSNVTDMAKVAAAKQPPPQPPYGSATEVQRG